MDPATITIIVGLLTLIAERIFSIANKVKKSKCFGVEVEMNTPTIEKKS